MARIFNKMSEKLPIAMKFKHFMCRKYFLGPLHVTLNPSPSFYVFANILISHSDTISQQSKTKIKTVLWRHQYQDKHPEEEEEKNKHVHIHIKRKFNLRMLVCCLKRYGESY